jgi:hypothetical protein
MFDEALRVLGLAWEVTGRMAPYLLFGFLVAGLLSVWISPAWIERHLGGRGSRSVFRAALFGVPLPLCSCGVIPVAASLRRHGAGRGATAAFLLSTPQTGVDSLLVTWGMLGPAFAIFRPIAAFVSGALCGLLVDRMRSGEPEPVLPEAGAESCASGGGVRPWPVRVLHHGFVVLAGDVNRAVLAGLLVSGLLGALLPPSFIGESVGSGWGAMLAMLAIGIPLYVCSTASVPIALALMHAGISPGAALVFLITGPATNAATLATLVRLLGLKAAGVYLTSLTVTALGAGFFLDGLLVRTGLRASCEIHADGLSLGHHLAAAVLLVVLILPFFRRRS